MAIQDKLFGRPLATSEERAEHIGISAGIPIFGLDALTSAAYGPEQALLYLIPLGLLGIHLLIPIITSILILLVIVFFSYRQTIEAYPNGGGSYTVATENLGERAGLLAAAALMIDYILTAAVGISAGVQAVTSVDTKLIPVHAADVPLRAYPARAHQSARRQGYGRGLYASDLPLHWDAGVAGRRRHLSKRWQRMAIPYRWRRCRRQRRPKATLPDSHSYGSL